VATLALEEVGEWAAALLRGDALGRAVVVPSARVHRHTINLAGAWEWSKRVWCRQFGRPSGLEPGDSIRLVFAMPGNATVMLNGASLPALGGDAPRWSHDVTALLRDRNELTLAADVPPGADSGVFGRVALPEQFGHPALEIVSRVVDP